MFYDFIDISLDLGVYESVKQMVYMFTENLSEYDVELISCWVATMVGVFLSFLTIYFLFKITITVVGWFVKW